MTAKVMGPKFNADHFTNLHDYFARTCISDRKNELVKSNWCISNVIV